MKMTIAGLLLVSMFFSTSHSLAREINGYAEAHQLLLDNESGFLPKTRHKSGAYVSGVATTITGNLLNGNACYLRVEAGPQNYRAELTVMGDDNTVVFDIDLNDSESFIKETDTNSSMIYIDQKHYGYAFSGLSEKKHRRQILSVEILGKENGLTKRRISIENPEYMGFGGKSIVGCEVLYDVQPLEEEQN